MVTYQLQVERRTGKVRRPETDVLPLCYATNLLRLGLGLLGGSELRIRSMNRLYGRGRSPVSENRIHSVATSVRRRPVAGQCRSATNCIAPASANSSDQRNSTYQSVAAIRPYARQQQTPRARPCSARRTDDFMLLSGETV